MKNAVSFGICFIPKSSKAKNGTAPLYARITVNGERIELSLQRRITLNLWNEKRSRLKGHSKESKQVNPFLDHTSYTYLAHPDLFPRFYTRHDPRQTENQLRIA